MAQQFVLFESASGYALFERLQAEEIGEVTEKVQESIADFSRFSKMVRLKAFVPFLSAENALENLNDVAAGNLNTHLKNFLEMNLPKSSAGKKEKKKSKIELGLAEEKLAGAIQDELGITCVKNSTIFELLRGIRQHFAKLVGKLNQTDLEKAQLGLAHSYSRAKVRFNVHKVDNMIIQSINLLDQMDKDVNTFAMRVREWYSWHFPELVKIVPDNYKFAKLVVFIKNKGSLKEEAVPELENVTGDAEKAKQIYDASRTSMGTDISDFDMANIVQFAKRVINLVEYRQKLADYLSKKMHDVAPNLTTLMGESIGARLIAHAGSLTNLAKYPASTVQILGAEKALFRALKTKGNTPKYGIIFNSSFIGKANTKNKGRISRYLANKASIASRIDAFSEGSSTTVFGAKLKEQVEERLKFYDTGNTPRKNIEVMKEAIAAVEKETDETSEKSDKSDKKSKKKKRQSVEMVDADGGKESSKKKKKAAEEKKEEPAKKKKKKAADEDDEEPAKKKKKKSVEGEKKKKKKKSKE
eukprot:TRINITY_DN579_c0_g3_i1.p1 TRINITY_DN579_c0_g3~~TRINITY_DN579_c0_g3_i1.p1  ORF type:complete len:528 (-),score=229.30 TRINITY_DN579_c0_g3_i1:134-1717(-)